MRTRYVPLLSFVSTWLEERGIRGVELARAMELDRAMLSRTLNGYREASLTEWTKGLGRLGMSQEELALLAEKYHASTGRAIVCWNHTTDRERGEAIKALLRALPSLTVQEITEFANIINKREQI